MNKFKVGDKVRLKHPETWSMPFLFDVDIITNVYDANYRVNGRLWHELYLELVPPAPGITATVNHETVRKPVSVTVVIPYEDALKFAGDGSEPMFRQAIREALK